MSESPDSCSSTPFWEVPLTVVSEIVCPLVLAMASQDLPSCCPHRTGAMATTTRTADAIRMESSQELALPGV